MSQASQRHPHDPHLNLTVLRLLAAIDELGGVGAAARALGMTQPSASRSLASLERHLGYVLLERTPRGSTLTRNGLAVVGQARAVLGAQERLERTVDALASSGPARLELAASRTIGEHLVPSWLGEQATSHPDTWVSFRFDNSANVARLVLDGTVPLGFVEDPTPLDLGAPHPQQGIVSETLCTDDLRLVVPPGHPWVGTTVGPRQLSGARLIEREPGSGTRATLDAAVPQRQRPLTELDSNAAIVAAVAAGVGPTVLSGLAVDRLIVDGQVVRVAWDGPALSRPLRAIWLEGTRASREVRDFLTIARRQCALRAQSLQG